jgi:uncharacterized membrane protein (Fun14 family)
MMRFLAGLGVGALVGYLLGFVIPIQVFMIICLVMAGLVVLVFFLFHLGVRDFQEY